ncbi:murein hydrolase activator EnvC family protein [Pectinatus haikarae]|uniref:Murein DD-endopeptidase MepM/ murein hydrolase activator NlpD n=1 Tax=Pectinatus haikarae TaxID=349096 RepID=A0ABT9Y3X2_9FIRM|nr:M23 family metallopeptidase [Pectinatus haikarae]MDQ0202523.1 murein DD-endopeptidase MepM/ murein hydrolase activator NlpD [Pectinatus haikarae]
MFFHKQRLYAFTLLLLFTIFCSSASAASLQDKLDGLKKQATEKQTEIDSAKSKENTISEQMRTIAEQVDNATAAYNEIKGQLDETQKKIDENEDLLKKTQQNLDKREKVLYKRLRDIYMHGQISYIEVLVGADSFSDFLTRMDLIKRIIKYDYDLINGILAEKQVITDTKKELETDRSKTEKLTQSAKEKADILQNKKAQQQTLLDKVKNDRATAERAYDELMAASRQVEQMILAYTSSNSDDYAGGGSGQFIWPISGPITSPFGWRTHPIYGTRIFHSGIDIGGDYGLPIHAAAAGTVIYAGWISGYGNAVIISHGGGLQTLYGHNQSLNVSEGQRVSQGQVISFCGSTGNSTGPHCHFEVRKNGEPVNPLNYL